MAYVGSQANGTKTAVLVYGPWPGGDHGLGDRGSRDPHPPVGTYSVLALEGQTSTNGQAYAALASTTVQDAMTLALSPSTAITSRFTVGSA